MTVLLLISCATPPPPSRAARAEKKGIKIERLLTKAEQFLEAAEPKAASAPLGEAEKMLEDPLMKAYPDRTFLKERLGKAQEARVLIVKELVRREAQAKVDRQKDRVIDILERFEASVQRLAQAKSEVTKFEHDAALGLRAELDTALEEGRPMAKDQAYAAVVRDAQKKGKKLGKVLQKASRIVAFREGPVRARREGLELMSQAKAVGDKKQRKSLYKEARNKFLSCSKSGKAMLKKSPKLRKLRLFIGARKTSPKAVVSMCTKKAKKAKRLARK